MEYKKQLVKFDLNNIALASLIMFAVPFIVCAAINVFIISPLQTMTGRVNLDLLVVISGLIIGIVIHEGLHALGGLITGAAKPKDINFGINLKQGMFFCHFKKPMTVSSYMFVLILPLIVTGIIPLVISTIYGNIYLIVIFSFMVSGAAGDIIMFGSLIKKDKKALIFDHESAPAYYLLYKKESLPADFEECTDLQEQELLDMMKKSPYSSEKGKKNPLIKILLIAIFLVSVIAGIFLAAIILKLI